MSRLWIGQLVFESHSELIPMPPYEVYRACDGHCDCHIGRIEISETPAAYEAHDVLVDESKTCKSLNEVLEFFAARTQTQE